MNKEVIERNFTRVTNFIKTTYRSNPTLSDSLYDAAIDALINRSNNYNPDLGCKEITHILWGVKKGILNVCRKQGVAGVSGRGHYRYKSVSGRGNFDEIVKVRQDESVQPHCPTETLDTVEYLKRAVDEKTYAIMLALNSGEKQVDVAKRFGMSQGGVSFRYQEGLAKMRRLARAKNLDVDH